MRQLQFRIQPKLTNYNLLVVYIFWFSVYIFLLMDVIYTLLNYFHIISKQCIWALR